MNSMEKAFGAVRGALSRNDKTELTCKKVWLERVLRDLPNTVWATLAVDGLDKVNERLSAAKT